MDDRLAIGVIIYIFLSVSLVIIMPDEFFSGTSSSVDGAQEVRSSINVTAVQADADQPGFILKILQFFFASWTISGIPLVLGVLLELFNLVTIIVGVAYVYDKIRGI